MSGPASYFPGGAVVALALATHNAWRLWGAETAWLILSCGIFLLWLAAAVVVALIESRGRKGPAP